MNKPTPGKWRISPYYPGDIIADNPQSRYPLVVAVCPLADDANFIMAMGEACYLVNPSNPLAVAEALPELLEVFEEMMKKPGQAHPGTALWGRAIDALAKLEAKP